MKAIKDTFATRLRIARPTPLSRRLQLGLLAFLAFPGLALAAPVPSVSLSLDPTAPFIGQDVTLSLDFDNTDADETGFGPFVDLILPVNGADGVAGVGADGIDLAAGVTQATYLGVPVTTITQIFPSTGGGCVDHPYALDSTGAKMRVCGTAGDKLVTIQLPFGSFVPDQPRATIKLPLGVSEDADLGTLLTLKARGGFRFGADALNNPTTDPSILCPNQVADAVSNSTSWTTKLDVTPTLITLKKTYSGPEDETATGPNFPRQYTIEVDVADGQTVENLDVTDFLPDNMAYLRLVSTSGGTATTITEPSPSGQANATPNNELTVRFASITGGTPASVTF